MTPRVMFGRLVAAVGFLTAIAVLASQRQSLAMVLPYVVYSAVCVTRFESLTATQKLDVMTVCLGVSATTLYLLDWRFSDPVPAWLCLAMIVLSPSLPFVYAAWLSQRDLRPDPFAGVPGPSKTLNNLLLSKRLREAAVMGVRKPFARRDPWDEPMF